MRSHPRKMGTALLGFCLYFVYLQYKLLFYFAVLNGRKTTPQMGNHARL